MLSNSLVSISKIFDQKFDKFYLPLIGVFLILLFINSIYYIHFFVYSSNEWLVADWLINYSGGFVRRGLSGELILLISNFFNIAAQDSLFFLFSSLQLFFFIFIFILLRQKQITFWFFLIFASPSFLSFYIFDPSIIARKEILIYLTYLAWMITLSRHSKVTFNTSIIFSILGIFITLLHEIFVFYSVIFYLITIIYFKEKSLKLNYSIFIPLSSAATVILIMLVPTGFNSLAICSRIIEAGIEPSVCEGGILSWPARGVIEGFIHNLTIYNFWTPFGLVLILFLPIIPFFLFSYANHLLINQPSNRLLFFLAIQLISMSPLFLVATDWGRWVNIQSILLGISMIFFLMPKISTNKIHIKNNPNQQLIGFGVPIILLIFMSSWNLRHCCRDGNFLFEFNGLIGSLASLIL